MDRSLTLQEALAQSMSTPRRATVYENDILYHVTLKPDGTLEIVVKSMEGEAAGPASASAESLPERGWVPGASLRIPTASPAYRDAPPGGRVN